ncbi:MAG: phage tail protein [Gammaproteobacteria bacterium]|jgi:phage tail-like protein
MARGAELDPYLAFNFLVEIEGLTVGGFSEVTGLQVDIEVEDYREGGVNGYIHKLLGPVRYPSNLVLKRGVMSMDDLLGWYQLVMSGTVELKNVSIILQDTSGEDARRWDFLDAYPVRWNSPELRAVSSDVAIETLELVHKGLISVS